jgi:putative transcriptional regulator
MPIVVNLDVMLAKRKMNLTELSFRVGITIAKVAKPKPSDFQPWMKFAKC